MTIEEIFSDLYDKYDEDLFEDLKNMTCFHKLSYKFTEEDMDKKGTVAELNKEIGQDHFLYGKKIQAVAKCESNDDVLYVIDNGRNADSYYIFHLTYSKHNPAGFLRYEELKDVYAVKAFIEQSIKTKQEFADL